MAGLFGALLSLAVGVTSDRLAHTPFHLAYEITLLLISTVALFNAQVVIASG